VTYGHVRWLPASSAGRIACARWRIPRSHPAPEPLGQSNQEQRLGGRPISGGGYRVALPGRRGGRERFARRACVIPVGLFHAWRRRRSLTITRRPACRHAAGRRRWRPVRMSRRGPESRRWCGHAVFDEALPVRIEGGGFSGRDGTGGRRRGRIFRRRTCRDGTDECGRGQARERRTQNCLYHACDGMKAR